MLNFSILVSYILNFKKFTKAKFARVFSMTLHIFLQNKIQIINDDWKKNVKNARNYAEVW